MLRLARPIRKPLASCYNYSFHYRYYSTNHRKSINEFIRTNKNEINDSSQDKILSDLVLNFMSRKLSDMESFLVSQSSNPLSSNSSFPNQDQDPDQGQGQAQASNKSRILFKQLYNSKLDTKTKLANPPTIETLSLLNQSDLQYLQTTNQNLVNSTSDFEHYYCKVERENVLLSPVTLLQCYLRFPRKVYQRSYAFFFHLVSFQWFHNASILIPKECDTLESVLLLLNKLFQSHPSLKDSRFLRTLFTLHLYENLPNGLIINQIDPIDGVTFNVTKTKHLFTTLNNLKSINFASISDIEKVLKIDIGDEDLDLLGLSIICIIDQVKKLEKDPFEQVNNIIRLVNKASDGKLSTHSGFIGVLIGEILKISEPDVSRENYKYLSVNRVHRLFSILFGHDLNVSQNHMMFSLGASDIIQLLPYLPIFGENQRLKLFQLYCKSATGDYDPVILQYFAKNIRYRHVFMDGVFKQLTTDQQASAVLELLFDMSNHNTNFLQVKKVLNQIDDELTLTHITNTLIHKLQHGKMEKHLNFAEMHSLISYLAKDRKFSISKGIQKRLASYYSKVGLKMPMFFAKTNPGQAFNLLCDFLLKHDSMKPQMFLPVLFQWFKMHFKDYKSSEFSSLMRVFNYTLDTSAHKSPKDSQYNSGVLMSYKVLLRPIGYHLFSNKDNDNYFLKQILEARIAALCDNNKDDKLAFLNKMDQESIVLNYLMRSYTEFRLNKSSEKSNRFAIDLETFDYLQDLLDETTLFKTNAYLQQHPRGNKSTPTTAIADVFADAHLADTISKMDILPSTDISDEELNILLDALFDNKHKQRNELEEYEKQTYDTSYEVTYELKSHLAGLSNSSELAKQDISDDDKNQSSSLPVDGRHFISYDEKIEAIRSVVALRTKSDMIESIVPHQSSEFIDRLLNKYYNDYNKRIPVILIHSIMLGILNSHNLSFVEKMNYFKLLDLICIVTMYCLPKMMKKYVKNKQVRIALVDEILAESIRINSGSLATLGWGLKKVINSPNCEKVYKPDLLRWKLQLAEMEAGHVGFWSDECNGKWD